MVREKMYNKIQSYKQMGYSIRKTAREADIDRKTVQKYWNMPQDEYVRYMAQCCSRTKILDPYKDEITTLLETWPNITSGSSMTDFVKIIKALLRRTAVSACM